LLHRGIILDDDEIAALALGEVKEGLGGWVFRVPVGRNDRLEGLLVTRKLSSTPQAIKLTLRLT
jgi:hypothetical protein